MNRPVERFPLSPMQKGILFEDQIKPDSGINIEQIVIDLPEEIDLSDLKAAWIRAVTRHSVLRAGFQMPFSLLLFIF